MRDFLDFGMVVAGFIASATALGLFVHMALNAL